MAGERDSEDVPMDDELARRLRELDWPKPPPGLRERSLEDFQRRIAAEHAREPDPAVRHEP
ncbi:MAG TPA: hypothetical protein VHF89_05530 [Solirubrobacteraceae bacterium]|nr:hypothetical protein [Solirubrobacteraceae bacterium]